jgi:phage FluMu protein Com
MQSDSTRPAGDEWGRLPLRCLGCDRFQGSVGRFTGRVNIRCTRCKNSTGFERQAETETALTRIVIEHPDLRAIKHSCAHCGHGLLNSPGFSGLIERKCHRCRSLNRITGERHSGIVERRAAPIAWVKDRPKLSQDRWTAEILIPLLEERWETFVREKRRAQAELAVGLRFDVFSRDGFRCRYCGRSVDDGIILHADHVVAQSKGGPTTLENLVTACLECNLGKSDKELIAIA